MNQRFKYYESPQLSLHFINTLKNLNFESFNDVSPHKNNDIYFLQIICNKRIMVSLTITVQMYHVAWWAVGVDILTTTLTFLRNIFAFKNPRKLGYWDPGSQGTFIKNPKLRNVIEGFLWSEECWPHFVGLCYISVTSWTSTILRILPIVTFIKVDNLKFIFLDHLTGK